MTRPLTRRDFLRRSGHAAAGAGMALAAAQLHSPARAASGPLGANDRVVVGIIGCGGMGRANLRYFSANPDVQIAAVCDVFEPNLQQAVKETGDRARPYRDFREVLDRRDIDAVVVATPDHWHALATTAACQAGKDVYVEKPLAHNVREGRAMVDVARRYGRVVQMGTQQRSGEHFRRAVEIVRSGALGPISLVRTWNVENRAPGFGSPADCDPPKELDWDFWLGPAPRVAYNPNRCLYNFRHFWDYAGGMLTDWGTHLIDIVHWAMDADAPLAVAASGGKYVLEDNRESPDTLEAVYDYPGFTLTYSLRQGNGRTPDGRSYGTEFYGTNGTLFVDRGGYQVYPEGSASPAPQSSGNSGARPPAMSGGGSPQNEPHVRNFLDCVKTRERPVSDVETGHRTTTAPLLGNIAYRTGRKIRWDREREEIVGDDEAGRLLGRAYRAPWRL